MARNKKLFRCGGEREINMGILTFKDRKFYMDGEEFVVISGAMHYFRIPREYWYDRLLKLKECGFNTVETYTCRPVERPVHVGRNSRHIQMEPAEGLRQDGL